MLILESADNIVKLKRKVDTLNHGHGI